MASDIIFMEGFEFYNNKVDLQTVGYDAYGDHTTIDGHTRNSFSLVSLDLSNNFKEATVGIPIGSDLQEGYIGFAITPHSEHYLVKVSLDTDDQFTIDYDGSNVILQDYEGTTMHSSEYSVPDGADWCFVEVYAKISDTNGAFTLKIDGDTYIQLTGINLKNPSIANEWNTLTFRGKSSSTRVDDIYVSTSQFHGDCTISRILPSAAGAHSDWAASSGDPYDCVNDAPFTDNTDKYIESDNPVDVSTFDMSEISGIEDYHPLAVKMSTIAERVNDLTPRSFKLRCISNGAIDETAEVDMPYNDYVWAQKLLPGNPDGNADWDWASLNAAEFGVELVS
ncbi:MAG: hypothetical protein ACOCQD_00580 [archaeon]